MCERIQFYTAFPGNPCRRDRGREGKARKGRRHGIPKGKGFDRPSPGNEIDWAWLPKEVWGMLVLKSPCQWGSYPEFSGKGEAGEAVGEFPEMLTEPAGAAGHGSIVLSWSRRKTLPKNRLPELLERGGVPTLR